MKVKDFLKSNSFRCIVVLLVIALVCGTVLALCNDLFYVSDEEVKLRSMAKIYDGEVSELVDVDLTGRVTEYSSFNCNAVIKEAMTAPGGLWLVKSKGDKCGYQNGSVVLWVSMTAEGGKLTKINKVILESYDSSQSLIKSINDEFLAQYASAEYADVVTGGKHFSNVRMSKPDNTQETEIVASGATYTSKAVNAAVNGAMDFVRAEAAKEGV